MAIEDTDWDVNQGSTWTKRVTLYSDAAKTTVVDLTGFLARGKVRNTHASTGVPLAEMDATHCFVVTPATGGIVQYGLGSYQTELAAFNGKDVEYDVEVYNGTTVYTSARGVLSFLRESTRDDT